VVAACGGGNPWLEEDGGGDGETPAPTIPAELAGDLGGVTYDPVAQTLTVTGVALDPNTNETTETATTYRRRPGLDRNGYEAYTAQSGSLDRHTTAYVREINGTQAAIVMTGGQFGHYFGGSTYSRSGTFSAPDFGPLVAGQENSGSVTYLGNYVGLLNGPGDGGDLKAVTPGTPVDIIPVQAAEVTGQVAINADFGQDMRVNGEIYNRVIVDNPGIVLENLELSPTALTTDGTFVGVVTQDSGSSTVGNYGGVFGGTDATEVAGTVFVQDHIQALDNEEEYGMFVLSQCGTANADPLCNQPSP
jgi:hypothetical protein